MKWKVSFLMLCILFGTYNLGHAGIDFSMSTPSDKIVEQYRLNLKAYMEQIEISLSHLYIGHHFGYFIYKVVESYQQDNLWLTRARIDLLMYHINLYNPWLREFGMGGNLMRTLDEIKNQIDGILRYQNPAMTTNGAAFYAGSELIKTKGLEK